MLIFIELRVLMALPVCCLPRTENCLQRGLVWTKVIRSTNTLSLPCEISLAIFNSKVNLIAAYPAGMFYTDLSLESQASLFISF